MKKYAANLHHVMSLLIEAKLHVWLSETGMYVHYPDLHSYLNGEMLEWTDTFKHLGNIITADHKDDSDIQL